MHSTARTRPGRTVDRGMVTAELAIGTGAVAILFALLTGGIGVLAAQMGCQSAATEIARQTARGDRGAVSAAQGRLPDGASVTVTRGGGGALAVVSLAARPWGDRLPPVPVRAEAMAIWEPGETP